MTWDGNGTYSRTNGTNTGATLWNADAAAGTKITTARHDTHDEDIATAITACLTKNNETKPTANFDPATTSNLDIGDNSLRWQHLFAEGVNFPATQVASADANTLDDYQEGTWTPQLSDGSNDATNHAQTSGHYTKIGNVVLLRGKVRITSKGSMSGALQIDDLPFTYSNDNPDAAVCFGTTNGMTTTAGFSVTGSVAPGTTVITLLLWDNTAGTTTLLDTDIGASATMNFSLTLWV